MIQKSIPTLLRIFLIILFFPASFSVAQICGDGTFTLTPEPDNGVYQPGQTVEVCGTITYYQQTGANWLHGIVPNFPPGWDMSTIVVTQTPNGVGTPNGVWMWDEDPPSCAPGWYFDSPVGGPLDGNPFNNWGDPSTTGPWSFCFEITVGTPDGSGGSTGCGGDGNPLDGAAIPPAYTLLGDGQCGSWGTNSPCDDAVIETPDPVELNCCDAESGISPGTLLICENGTFDLLDELIPPYDLGGEWNGPAGWAGNTTENGAFNPLVDGPGDYTYEVEGTDGCINATTITMEYNDLGTIAFPGYCESLDIPLEDLWPAPPGPVFIPGGTWTNPVGTEITDGILDPVAGPAGEYTYTYYNGNNCLTTAVLDITLASGGGSGGCAATIDVCSLDDSFCILDMLGCNPTGGGQAIHTSINGDFIAYYPNGDICIDPSTDLYLYDPDTDELLVDANGDPLGSIFTYALGTPPCTPSFVDLTVNFFEPVDPGEFTQATVCITDPPFILEGLLNGTPDSGLDWTTSGGDPVDNPFDPGLYDAGDNLTLVYSGGLENTLCFTSAVLQLTIAPADADAGENSTLTVCESDPAIQMTDTLDGTPQDGGIWYYNGSPHPGGNFFVPGQDPAGTYTYMINTNCGDDQADLVITVTATADPGTDGTLLICDNETGLPLQNGLGGTPDTPGVWTDSNGDVVNPPVINGNAVNDGEVYTYTVGSVNCQATSTVTIDLQTGPFAGTAGAGPFVYCNSDPAFDLFGLLDVPGSEMGSWTGPTSPTGPNGSTLDPATASTGNYTHTVTSTSCGTDTETIFISFEPEPNAGTNTTVTLCESEGAVDLPAILNGNPDGGGNWDLTGTGPITSPYDITGLGGNTLTFTYNIGSAGCSDQATLTINVDASPDAGANVSIDTCGTGGTLVLEDILLPGVDNNGVFTPATIPFESASSGTYTYVLDNNSCPADQADYTLNIIDPIEISNVVASCEASQLTYVVTFTVSSGSGNYEVVSNNGTITGNTFTSDPINVTNTYSFTLGDLNSDCDDITIDGAAPACDCPATAGFTTTDTDICTGMCVDLELELVGNGPFTVVYNDGTADQTGLYNDGDVISVCPTANTTYTLVSVEDQNCTGQAFGSVSVNVEALPDAGLDMTYDLCATNANFDLMNLNPAPPAGGSFAGGNTILLDTDAAGTYTYEMPGVFCPTDEAVYTLNVDAPLSISNLSVSCDPSQTSYIVSFEISGGSGNYDVVGPPGTLVGNIFTSDEVLLANDYSFSVEDPISECGDVLVEGVAPDCNCPATAAFATTDTDICSGICVDLELELEGSGPFTVVYNDGNADQTGLYNDGDIISVCPTANTTYTLVSVDDQNCTGQAVGSVTVNVEALPDAGPDLTFDLCATNGNYNLMNLSPTPPAGGSFAGGNTILLDANAAGTYIYEMPGVLCPTDEAEYTLNVDAPLSVSNLTVSCDPSQTSYVVSFDILGGTGDYEVNNSTDNIVGNTFTSGDLPLTNQSFVVSGGLCDDLTVDVNAPSCVCTAEGEITGSTTICAGGSALITFELEGDGPFDVEYESSANPGVVSLNNINNLHTISVNPTTTTTYTLNIISDTFCDGVVTGNPVVVNVDPVIQVSNLVETCDATGDNYVVSFDITGGSGAYNISPAGGTLTAGTYQSISIPSGQNYQYDVADNGGPCSSIEVSGDHTCDCISDAGSISPVAVDVCANESVEVSADGNAVLDGNDMLQYILHDGSATEIGNLLSTSSTGEFNYLGSLNYGQPYYIVVAVGNSLGSGSVDLDHTCTSISEGIAITFNALPTANISGAAQVCPGESVDLSVTFTGDGGWDFSYAIDGDTVEDLYASSATYTLSTNQPGEYTVTAVSDNNCAGSGSGEASLINFTPPTATLGGDPNVCIGSGDGPEISFTGTGAWTFVYAIDGAEQEAITSSYNEYTIPAEQGGLYSLVSVEGANCTGTVSGELDVEMVETPTASITGGGSVCEGELASFNVSLTGDGPWSIQYTVDGVPQDPLDVDDAFYTFQSGVDGDYVIEGLSDQNCSATSLDIISSAALTVDPIPSSEITTSDNILCFGQELEIGFNLQGTSPYNIVYVINEDTIAVNGVSSNYLHTMMPDAPVVAELISIVDGSGCASEPNLSAFVMVQPLPNAPELQNDTLCSGAEAVQIGVSAIPGMSYSWSPPAGLSDPNISNPTFTPVNNDFSPHTYAYEVTASDGECTARDTAFITVDPGPRAHFTFSPSEISSEDPVVYFENLTSGHDTEFFWTFDSLETSEARNPSFRFPDAVIADYNITLVATDPITGCSDDFSLVIPVKPELLAFIPNAFTPDGDGLNDLWGPVLSNIDPDNYRLTVFDRLGEIVFQTEDPKKKWNGSMNGDDYFVQPGVYVWLIETKNLISLDEFELQGHVTVVR